jgi:SPX domain protein involved in polyphosphate accumulation
LNRYERTAFQVPFVSDVRVSLDTNLNMIHEGVDILNRQERWFRDPAEQVKNTVRSTHPSVYYSVQRNIYTEK